MLRHSDSPDSAILLSREQTRYPTFVKIRVSLQRGGKGGKGSNTNLIKRLLESARILVSEERFYSVSVGFRSKSISRQ